MAYESFKGEPGLYTYRGVKVRFDFRMLPTNEVELARAWVADDEDREALLIELQGLWPDKTLADAQIKMQAAAALDKLIAKDSV